VRNLAPQRAPIGWDYLTPQEYLALAPGGTARTVAAVIHGDLDPPPRPWPQIRSNLKSLDGVAWVEILTSAAAPAFEDAAGFDLVLTDDFMIAAGRIEKGRGEALAAGARQLYETLLRLIADRGYPHLLRMWNILERINGEEDGLERYRRFCIGRHEAFTGLRPDLAERYPAATAVGAESGGLLVYFIAARSPGITVENPNQVSAFRYPAQYGPRSPSFSRALVKQWSGGATLFLSGTASITGHETQHAGDLAAQAEKTADNLESLVRAAERRAGVAFRLRDPASALKVYVRREADYPLVRDIVGRRFGLDTKVLFLRADICREALLVEIDGTLA
jgi:chorismate lyase/3-hydroxybenzoate synthase